MSIGAGPSGDAMEGRLRDSPSRLASVNQPSAG